MVREGLIGDDHLAKALERQIIFGGRLGTNLVEMGAVAEEALAKFLSKHLNVPYAEPSKFESIPQEALDSMTKEQVEKYTAVPLEKTRTRLTVAMKDPNDMAKVDEMRFILGMDIRSCIASEMRLAFALEKYYSVKRDLRYVNVRDADEGFEKKMDPSAVGIPSMPQPEVFKPAGRPAAMKEESYLGDESQLDYGSVNMSDGEAIADALGEEINIPQEIYDEPSLSDAPTVASGPPAPAPPETVAAPAPPPPQPAEQAPGGLSPYERLAMPADREDIGLAVIDAALAEKLKRAALFTLKGDILTGWHAAGEGVDKDRLLSLKLNLAQPSLFQDVVSDIAFYKGPILQIPQNNELIEALGGTPQEAVSCPLVIKGKVVGVLYADNGPGSMIASDVSRLTALMQKASMSLEILILKTKILAGI